MKPSNDLPARPATDPTIIYRYRDGLYAVDLLTAAIAEFDFFTWLADHPSDLGAICKHFAIVERPTDVMLTLFASMGLVRERGGVFELTELGREHAVKSSPWFLGPYYASLKERPVCIDMIKVLKSGKPANFASNKSEKELTRAMEETDFCNWFNSA